jgi:hypothetical protein
VKPSFSPLTISSRSLSEVRNARLAVKGSNSTASVIPGRSSMPPLHSFGAGQVTSLNRCSAGDDGANRSLARAPASNFDSR